MADESKHPALAMLRRLEERLEGLTEELQRVKGRLARAEAVLARLAGECGPQTGPDAPSRQTLEGVLLDAAGVVPPLAPGEDVEAFAEAVRSIRARRTEVRALSDDERAALEEALRNGIVSQEEVAAFRKRRGLE